MAQVLTPKPAADPPKRIAVAVKLDDWSTESEFRYFIDVDGDLATWSGVGDRYQLYDIESTVVVFEDGTVGVADNVGVHRYAAKAGQELS